MSHNDAVLIVNNGKIKFCCDGCDECMYVMSKYCKDVYNIDICMGCYYDNKFSHWALGPKERGRDWFDLRMKHLSDNRKKSDTTEYPRGHEDLLQLRNLRLHDGQLKSDRRKEGDV